MFQALGIPEQTWMHWRRKGRELAELAELGQPVKPKSQQEARDIELAMALHKAAETGRAYSICEDVMAIGKSKHWRARAWRLAKHDPENYGKEPVDVNLRVFEGAWEELHRIARGEDEFGDGGESEPSEEA